MTEEIINGLSAFFAWWIFGLVIVNIFATYCPRPKDISPNEGLLILLVTALVWPFTLGIIVLDALNALDDNDD